MGKPAILLVKEIYYPILAAVALPANLMTIVILKRGNCGLSKCIFTYLMTMSTTDLLVIIFDIIVHYILSYHFPYSFLYLTVVCRTILYLAVVTLDLSVWCTVSFTFDRFVVICCQKFKVKYCTKTTATAIVTTLSILIVLKEIPILFAYEPQQILDKVPWGCQSSTAFFSSPAGIAYVWFHSTWVVWLPFSLIILFNSLTIRRIVMANRTRTGLRNQGKENYKDSETESRRKSIILLFSISVSFILLWLTHSVSLAVTRLTNTIHYQGGFTSPAYIATETGDFLKFFSCVLNPCIYAVTQSKFRKELNNMVIAPWRIIRILVEKLMNGKNQV